MTYPINVPHTSAVRETAATPESGPQIPSVEVFARRIAREAERWQEMATLYTSMREHTIRRKAFDACAYTVARQASSLAIPTKLRGVSDYQPLLWAMVRERVAPWSELTIEDTGDGLVVLYEAEPIGEIQAKHLGWVRPLLSFGLLRVYLSRVTGADRARYTLGCNVVLGHVGAAVDALYDALGGSLRPPAPRRGSEVPSGDGAATAAPTAPVAVSATTRVPASTVEYLDQHGDGTPAPSALRLVVLPERETMTGDPDDVVLYREIDGTARMSVPFAPRHSPTGPEWSYGGSGPADAARSILLAFTNEETAEALYQRFKAEVIARVPHAGGVLRAADIRSWVAAREAARRS